MPILKIQGVPPLDGDYSLDITRFTNRELHLIKQESGVRAGEIEEAFAAGDNDLLVAITLIVLERAGKGKAAQLKDVVWDADAGSITFDLTDDEKAEAEEGDALPPVSGPAASSDGSEKPESSGPPSVDGSGKLASLPSRTGLPPSDIGATSDPATLAS